jgi:hypothetical protein
MDKKIFVSRVEDENGETRFIVDVEGKIIDLSLDEAKYLAQEIVRELAEEEIVLQYEEEVESYDRA